MEALRWLLKRVVNGGFLMGFQVRGRGGEGVKIFHLLFVDDTLVFHEGFKDHMTYLSWLLIWFEVISGLKINWDKSKLIPMWEVNDIDDLDFELGCKVGSLSFSYLGLPLSAPFKFVTGWKRCFGKGWLCGRDDTSPKQGELPWFEVSCLICLFTLCHWCVSQGRLIEVRADLEGLSMGWWGSWAKTTSSKIGYCCLDKRKRGLGVKHLSILNKALLCKWN